MADRNFVPRTDQVGDIGTLLKRWAKGWFKDLYVSGKLTDGTNEVSVSDLVNSGFTDEKVKASGTDPTPGYLSDKVDGVNLDVVSQKIVVKSGSDLAGAITDKHTHSNKSTLDAIEEALTSALMSAYDAAVIASHSHSNKSILDNIEEAFTSALKSSYDGAVSAQHSHSNKVTLDAIQEAFTTALKNKLDGIESGAVSLSTVKSDTDIADALSKRHSNSLDHTQGTDSYSTSQIANDSDVPGTSLSDALEQLNGIVGPQGPQGVTGSQGPQGVQGDTGTQGFQGLKGDAGNQGPQGNVGSQGPQGFQGVIGNTGSQGNQGTQGNTGPQGPQGVIGATGPQGSTGNQGATGSQGPQGVAGSTGPQGTQGVQGAVGSQGNQGNQGNQGAQGPNQVSTSTATNITGILKGNGANVLAATPSTDYLVPNDVQSGNASSDGVSTSTSGTYAQKLRLSFTPTTSGNYLLIWSCETVNSNGGTIVYVQVQQDDTTQIAGEFGAEVPNANVYEAHGGIAVKALTAGVATFFDMDWRRSANNGRIRYARMAIHKII